MLYTWFQAYVRKNDAWLFLHKGLKKSVSPILRVWKFNFQGKIKMRWNMEIVRYCIVILVLLTEKDRHRVGETWTCYSKSVHNLLGKYKTDSGSTYWKNRCWKENRWKKSIECSWQWQGKKARNWDGGILDLPVWVEKDVFRSFSPKKVPIVESYESKGCGSWHVSFIFRLLCILLLGIM